MGLFWLRLGLRITQWYMCICCAKTLPQTLLARKYYYVASSLLLYYDDDDDDDDDDDAETAMTLTSDIKTYTSRSHYMWETESKC